MDTSQDEDLTPAITHKWCEVSQDALLASRGYYRLSSIVMMIIIFYVCYKVTHVSWWVIVPVGWAIIALHRYAGERVEQINFNHSKDKWDQTHD